METIRLESDIKLLCVEADVFPTGVLAAHQKLHTLMPFDAARNYFGISRPENGGAIVYKAAAEQLHETEATNHPFEVVVLRAGAYHCIIVEEFSKHMERIGEAFLLLLKQGNIDPQGYCVEWYIDDADTVRCMVRIADLT